MYNIFTYSSVSGHLGCLHVLAILNSAAMNIGMYVSFQIIFFSWYNHFNICISLGTMKS